YIRNQELADQQLGAEDLSRPKIQSIVQTSLKTAFGGSQSNLQLCWRLLAHDGWYDTVRLVCSHGDADELRAGGSQPLVHPRVCGRLRAGLDLRLSAGRLAVRAG